MAAVAERNQDATVYVGGLDDKVSEHLLAELFIQGNKPMSCLLSWTTLSFKLDQWLTVTCQKIELLKLIKDTDLSNFFQKMTPITPLKFLI